MSSRRVLLALIASALVLLCACGGGHSSTTTTTKILSSIQVTPATPSVAAGLTQQFTATGTYSDGSTADVTPTVTWSSSNTSLATISASGLATSKAVGSVTITATSGTVSGTGTFSITAAALVSVSVTSTAQSVAAGLTQQFTATGNYTDGSTKNLTTSVTWSCSDTTVATVSASGLATTLKQGSVIISATSGTTKGTENFAVNAAALVSVAVNTPAAVDVGSTEQLVATGTYTDGSKHVLPVVTWSVGQPGDTGSATVSASGVLTGVTAGTVTVTAGVSGALPGSASVNVNAQATQVSGTAATGLAIAGATVTLKDSKGATATGTTDDVGVFHVTTTGMTPPFFLKIVPPQPPPPAPPVTPIYSVSADASPSTIINIHPLSDLVVRSWYNSQDLNVDSAFANPVSNPPPAPQQVQLLANVVTQMTELWLTNNGIDTAQFNLISSPFTADGTGLDAVLDQTKVDLSNPAAPTVTITDGTTTQTSNVTYDINASSVTVNTSTTDGSGTSVSTTSTVVPAQTAEQAAVTAIQAQMDAFAQVVNSKGSALTSTDILPFTASTLLDSGEDRSTWTADMVATLAGKTVSLTVLRLVSLDTANGLADVVFTASVSMSGQTQNQSKDFRFINSGGTWLLYGDQRIAHVELQAEMRTQLGAPISASGADINAATTAPQGRVTAVTVTGGGVFNNTALGQGAEIVTPTGNWDKYAVLSQPLTALVPTGTIFTYTLSTPGGPVVYTIPTNAFTTETITLASMTVNGVAIPASEATDPNLTNFPFGQPIVVNWTLPKTFPIASVKLQGQYFTGNQWEPTSFNCDANRNYVLPNTATRGTISFQSTCNGMPTLQVNIIVEVDGANGEKETIFYLFNGVQSGGGKPVSVSINNPPSSVNAGATQQFSATVSNATNTAATWSLSNCSSNCGSIDANSGLYTAPSAPASTFSVTVKATSVQDPNQSATATFNVNAVSVAIKGWTTTLNTGQSFQFNPIITGAANTAGTWSISGGGCTPLSNCGSIDGNGLYTAPSAVPTPSTVTVTLTSVQDPSKSASTSFDVVAAGVISVVINNPPQSVNAGATQQFTATVSYATNTAVTWNVNCPGNCGSIDVNGLYTAPNAAPYPNSVTVGATSVQDSTKHGYATFSINVPAPISVSIDNQVQSITQATTLQFTATVSNSTQGVTWSISNCTSGCGTIDAVSGLYTAPGTPPNPNTVGVTATSNQDNTKSDTRTFSINPPQQIVIQVSPGGRTLAAGDTPTFSAAVSGTQTTGVNWSCTPANLCGSFTANTTSTLPNPITYTTPQVTAPLTVYITATSVADNVTKNSAVVTIIPEPPVASSSALNGQYAFQFSGYDANGPVTIGGSLTFNGLDSVSAGVLDIRNSASTLTNQNVGGGTYVVFADGRGSVTFRNESNQSAVVGTFRFVMDASGNARVIEFDDNTGMGRRGTGVLVKQDPSAFSSLPSGSFSFLLTGTSGSRNAVAGRFDTDGSGGMSNGLIDMANANKALQSVTMTGSLSNPDLNSGCVMNGGTSCPSTLTSFGRFVGTFTPNTSKGGSATFAMYVVSASQVLIVDIDQPGTTGPSAMSGSMLAQSGTYTTASLPGVGVFNLTGEVASTAGTQYPASTTILGLLATDGGGNLTSGSMLDQNSNGTVTTAASVTGTYTMSGNGRGTLTYTANAVTRSLVLYMTGANGAFLLDGSTGTSNDVLTGTLEAQTGGPYDAKLFSGTYSIALLPAVAGSNGPNGWVNLDGTSAWSGTVDESGGGGDLRPDELPAGSYTVDASGNGRGTLAVNTTGNNGGGAEVFYIVSPSKAYAISNGTDTHDSVVVIRK